MGSLHLGVARHERPRPPIGFHTGGYYYLGVGETWERCYEQPRIVFQFAGFAVEQNHYPLVRLGGFAGNSSRTPVFRAIDHTSRLVIVVPYWCVAAIIGVSLARRAARAHRLRSGAALIKCCPHCGYDLRATPDRCPECGRPVTGNASTQATSPPAATRCSDSTFGVP